MEHPRHVEACNDSRDRCGPIEKANAERRQRTGRRDCVVLAPERGENQEDQANDEGHVDAAMGRLRQQAEACRVVMEKRQCQQQGGDKPGSLGQQRPERHFRVQLGFDFLQIGFGQRLIQNGCCCLSWLTRLCRHCLVPPPAGEVPPRPFSEQSTAETGLRAKENCGGRYDGGRTTRAQPRQFPAARRNGQA